MKKKLLINEDTIAFLKSENHRLETEATKQQRRIEQLLNLSEGVKTSSTAQSVRREIEKSILVRQLKQQLAHLRNLVADKDVEIENMKRDVRFTRVKEVEFERDEYYSEIQRLLKTLEELKEELHRERQRREWNSKMAGETGDDLRRELAKLASGYQNILTNISTTAKPTRPSSAGAVRSNDHHRGGHKKVDSSHHNKEPQSSRPARETHTREDTVPQQIPSTLENEGSNIEASLGQDRDFHQSVDNVIGADGENVVAAADLNRQSLDAGFNTEDYETTDGNSSKGTGIEPKITFQPLGSFLPQQQAVYIQAPQMITALPTVPQHQFTPKFNAGDRVKAKFRGGEAYYPGRVSVVQADGLYRIVYDDNDEEPNVPESRIMLIDGEANMSGAASVASAFIGMNTYKVGDKVEALYYNGTKWYKGEVKGFAYVEAKKSFAYDVLYEDGDREKQVLEANVRLLNAAVVTPSAPAPTLVPTANQVSAESIPSIDESTVVSVGEKARREVPPNATNKSEIPQTNQAAEPVAEAPVIQPIAPVVAPTAAESPTKPAVTPEFTKEQVIEALYDKGTVWFPGKVLDVHITDSSAVYDILYDDGDRESGVAAAFIRKRQPPASTTGAAAQNNGPTYNIGEKIEGYFEEYKAWFAGQIKGVNNDGSYYVLFDDGDEDKNIVATRLRKKVVSIRKEKYDTGERIEARFQGDAAWFPGKIIKVNRTGSALSYNILYDDGDTEEEVVSELIRVLDSTLSQPPSQQDLPVASTAVDNAPKPSTTSADSLASPLKQSTQQISTPSSNNSKQLPQRHTSVTSTNLDNFLDELSDDGDGPLPPIGAVESSGENEYRDEFEA